MMIITLETDETVQRALGAGLSLRAWLLYLQPRFPVPMFDRVVGFVAARVNHGRWIVDCPYCKCAMLASKREPLFWCPKCGLNGEPPKRVIFPQETPTIEKLLLMRPDPQNRNWERGETVAQLARENLEHGCVNWGGA